MIVYPGQEGRIREQRGFWESLVDDQIAGLDAEKREKVSGVCASFGLDKDATRIVLATTCDLVDFERFGRQSVLTTAERYKAIEYIRDAAIGIAEVLGDLSTSDRIQMAAGVALQRRELGLDGTGVGSPLAFSAWARAAQRLLDRGPGDKGKGGRRPLLVEYGRFVASLAGAFDEAGLPVGRGGAFERLCAAVFESAGVRAAPEGAIRYYLKERKKRTTTGPENSSKCAVK